MKRLLFFASILAMAFLTPASFAVSKSTAKFLAAARREARAAG